MKILLVIILLPLFAFTQQIMPPGRYVKVKDDGSGLELFTLNAITSADTSGSTAKMLSKYKSDSIHAALTTLIGTKSASNHNHTGVYQPVGTYATGSGTASGTNTGDNSVNTTYANDFRAANFVAGTNYLAPNGSAAALTNFPTLNQNTSGTAAGLSTPLSFASGGIGSGAATSATTGTITVNMTTEMITVTPTGAMTFNASGGVTGQRITFIVTTSGASSFNLTFGTNFKSIGVLATGTTTARTFTVSFVYNGSLWLETGRTAAMP